MAGHFGGDAGAAVVFLVLYLLVWVGMTWGYFQGRYKIRSRWTIVYSHGQPAALPFLQD